MNKLLKTGIAVGGILMSGCGITGREVYPVMTFGFPTREKITDVQCFIGRDWNDYNKDGFVDEEEVYSPGFFRRNENIVLIADIYDGKGSSLIVRIWNDKTGRVLKASRKEICKNKEIVQYNFDASAIYNHKYGGEGSYGVAWYINSELIKREEFKIER